MDAIESERFWMWWLFCLIVIGLPIVVAMCAINVVVGGVLFLFWLGFTIGCLVLMGDGKQDKS